MSTYAQTILTDLGFKRVTYKEFLALHQQQARELFGDDIDLSDESPLGQWVKFISYQRAEDNELAEAVYLSRSVDIATGTSLDYAVGNYGVSRFKAEKSEGVNALRVSLTPGDTLIAGFIVATEKDVRFRTTTSVTDTDNDGVVLASLEAVEYGQAGNVTAGTAITIQTPTVGVTAAELVLDMVGGRDKEIDKDLRARYYRSIAQAGGSTTDSVLTALLKLPDVRAAAVSENDLDEVDENGVPPHSIAPVVLGGNPQEIARAIHEKKAGGIRSYGTEIVIVRDMSDNDKEIGFSYATPAPIYVNVNITKNAAFPVDGAKLVEREIIQYIGGTDDDGGEHQGLGMADSVIHAQVLRSITVAGIEDVTVTMRKGDTGPFEAANIHLGAVEVAETDGGKVVITVA